MCESGGRVVGMYGTMVNDQSGGRVVGMYGTMVSDFFSKQIHTHHCCLVATVTVS